MMRETVGRRCAVPDTQLILVEGMPGTGKSTVSQLIDQQLSTTGQPSHWCHEESADHPVRLLYDLGRHRSSSDYCEEAVSLWQSYADRLRQQDSIAVLDAAVLQNHIRSMMIFCCETSAQLDLVGRIDGVIAHLQPVWIYLNPTDIEKTISDVVAARGQRMLDLWIKAHDEYPCSRRTQTSGYDGFIAFWEEFCEISDRALDRVSAVKLRQNVAHDAWETGHHEILDFLGLPSPAGPASVDTLDRLVGAYVPLHDASASAFTLRTGEGCLIASVDQPTIDIRRGPIGCFREARLIPRGNDRFQVAAWPHEVQFIEDGDGDIVSMHLSVSADGWEHRNEVYAKR